MKSRKALAPEAIEFATMRWMTLVRIPLMRSTFFEEASTKEQLIDFIRAAPKLSMGDACAGFEKNFAAYQERRHALLVTNGSAANLGLIQALLNLGRLKTGDRIGVSAVTWATNVMPLLQLGLVPVPLDCSPLHLNVTSEEVKKYADDLRAVFLTNVLGFCGDIDVIRSLCREKEIILLEDNCESLGTRYRKTLLGNFGLASTFSFFVGHHLSTIEGGMICTDDEELADMLLMVRAHGWDRPLSPAKQKALRETCDIDDFHATYTFHELAYNIRPTEITGFLGTHQLPMLEKTIERRGQNFARMRVAVAKRPDLYLPLEIGHIERVSSFAMPVITTSEKVLSDTIARFQSAGVEIRPVIAGDITQHPFWTKYLPPADLPGATLVHRRGFYCPNNPDLTNEEVDLLCSLLEARS